MNELPKLIKQHYEKNEGGSLLSKVTKILSGQRAATKFQQAGARCKLESSTLSDCVGMAFCRMSLLFVPSSDSVYNDEGLFHDFFSEVLEVACCYELSLHISVEIGDPY